MSDELRGYDNWKTTPPEDNREECDECHGTGEKEHVLTGAPEVCTQCQGEGYIDPPTPEDIAERRADEMLSDPDFNRETGRYDEHDR